MVIFLCCSIPLAYGAWRAWVGLKPSQALVTQRAVLYSVISYLVFFVLSAVYGGLAPFEFLFPNAFSHALVQIYLIPVVFFGAAYWLLHRKRTMLEKSDFRISFGTFFAVAFFLISFQDLVVWENEFDERIAYVVPALRLGLFAFILLVPQLWWKRKSLRFAVLIAAVFVAVSLLGAFIFALAAAAYWIVSFVSAAVYCLVAGFVLLNHRTNLRIARIFSGDPD